MSKKTAIIMIIFVLILVLGFIFWKQNMNTTVAPGASEVEIQANQETIESETMSDQCAFADDIEAHKAAMNNSSTDDCSCIQDESMKNSCIQVITDSSAYQEAIEKKDVNLCEKITDIVRRDACVKLIGQ